MLKKQLKNCKLQLLTSNQTLMKKLPFIVLTAIWVFGGARQT